jgi:two-component system, OmpR family, sensor kinase
VSDRGGGARPPRDAEPADDRGGPQPLRRLLAAPHGVRAILLLSIGTTVLLALAVTFAVVYRDTGAQLNRQLDDTLRTGTSQLVGELEKEPLATAPPALAAARSFAYAQPYRNASVLLFAIAPGHGTASSYPELFGDKSGHGETSAAQRVDNAEGRQLAVPRPGYATQLAPDVGMLRTYEQMVTLASGAHIYAGAGEPVASVVRALAGVRSSFVLAAALALGITLLGVGAVGSRIATPLRRVADTAARVDGGDLDPRMTVSDSASTEIRVLASSFNRMLDRLRDAFEAQRDFIADASHELRTPLTVVRGQLDLLASHNNVTGDELERTERILKREVARMSRLTEDMLLLAQSDQHDFLRPEEIELRSFVTDLWNGLSLTAERRFDVGPLPQLRFRADPDRLAQALRNLGRNAIQHTSAPNGLVRIAAEVVPAPRGGGEPRIRFTVSDDGPGIPADHRARVFERFYRTDPARSRTAGGAGLGLAIVKAIAEAHGGVVSAGEAAANLAGRGAAVTLEVPASGPVI